MKKIIIYVLLSLLTSTIVYSQNPTNDSLLKLTWDKFAKAVLKKDMKLIKSLSTDCIECLFCVTNTRKEDSLFTIYMDQNEKLWFNKLNSELSFIPIDKFISEDFKIIFTKKIEEGLLDSTKLHFAYDNHNASIFSKPCIITTKKEEKLDFREVRVRTTEPDPSTKYEGSSCGFEFVKLNGQYKFCGFN
jgi:hypothetical protein